MIGHLDGVEGLLTTIDTDTGNIATAASAIETAVELIDDAATTIGTTDVLRVAIFDNNNNQITSFGGAGGTSTADDADFTAGTTLGTIVQGVYESTPTTVTDGDVGTIGITSGRRVKTSATIDAALPAGTNAIGKLAANSGVDIGDVDVTSCALPTGASTSAKQDTIIGHLDGVEALLTTIDADTSTLAGAVDSGQMQVDVVGALPAGTNNIGDVDILSIAAGDNNIGNVDIASALPSGTNTIGGTIPKTSTSGGFSIFRSLDLDETEEEVKSSAGQVYGIWFTNTASSTRWLKLYNATAANTTVGTTTPVITIGLPGNSSDAISGALMGGAQGIAFGTAISAAVTTAVGDSDTGAPGTNEVIVNIFYA
jgi:hypothetical protein